MGIAKNIKENARISIEKLERIDAGMAQLGFGPVSRVVGGRERTVKVPLDTMLALVDIATGEANE